MLSVEARAELEKALGLTESTLEEPADAESRVDIGEREDGESDSEVDEDEEEIWWKEMSYVSDTKPILSVAMNPCKAPVQLQKEDGSMMTLRGYSDAGSATTFIPERISKHVKQEDVEKCRVSYKGAVKGTPIAQFTGYFSAPGSTTKLPTPICVIKDDDWNFGDDVDILVGIPALAIAGTDIGIRPDHFLIRYRDLGVEHKVSQNGKLLHTHSIAAVTREEMREDSLRNYVHGDTVHPGRADWEAKVKHLKPDLREKVLKLLEKYKEQFWLQGFLPPIKDLEYSIQYVGPSFREPMIPLTPDQRKYIIPIFEDQVKQGILGEITENVEKLNYVSNMFLKTESDKLRPCINYRRLNAGTVKTDMPIPNKETMLAKLAGADAYNTMDAKAAYNQLPVAEASQKYMVFVVPGLDGHPRYFYPKRSNFGSSNMPGEFQRISGGFFEAANAADGVYIDDVTIRCMRNKDDEALAKLEEVLKRAKEKGVIFAFKKTHLFKTEVKILGEILSKDGRRPNPVRIKTLKDWPAPRTRRQLRSFLGLYNFLAPLKRHSTAPEIVALQAFTNTSKRYRKEEVVEPFEGAKKILCRWLLLHAYDPSRPTFVLTDSSKSGMGAVLMQVTKYGLRAIAVCSKKWPTRRKEYAAHVKEGMALVMGMRRFEHMLKHTKVSMVTDSENTVDLLTNPNWDKVPALWLRWRRYLSQTFRVNILHIPGKLNLVADVLSRQEFVVAPVWLNEETFFPPLMRSIYEAQQEDANIQEIVTKLANEKPAPKKLPKMYYFMENGLLKQMHHRFGKQIIIPRSMVKTILYLEHDVPLKGHPGQQYMRIGIKQHYWWEGIDEDVKEYVSSCRGCQLAKAKLSQSEMTNAIRSVSNLFSVFSMDLIDMNTVSSSYRYIMVLMDYYSSFVLLTNLRNKKAASIIKALWKCFTLFGPPEALLSDRGTEFVNKLAKKFEEETGVQHVLTYAYRPQGNGKNERSHAVIQNTLRIFAESKQSSWHKYTDGLQYMFNTRPNVETGIPPYEIVFGLKPRSLHNTTPFLEYNHAEMKKLRGTLNEVVRSHQLKKLHARSTTPPRMFEVGDRVIINRQFPRRPKHLFPATGPYEITSKVGTTGYHLRHVTTGEVKENVSHSHVFRFTERKGNEEQEGGTNSDSEEEELLNEAEDAEEANQLEAEMSDDETEEPPKKKPKMLAELESFNEPAKKSVLTESFEVGYMAVIRQDKHVRIGEIVEVSDDTIKLQWYGTTTNKDLARYRWKFYPGWETKDGEVEFKKTQVGGEPAMCEFEKREVWKIFDKLTAQSTLPSAIVKLTIPYTL